MIISIVAVKGGVGKTTICSHLAGYLHERKKSVAVIDCDMQKGASIWLKKALPDVQVTQAYNRSEILQSLKNLSNEAEIILCDGPAGATEPTFALMLRSDLALLPSGPSALDLSALKDTADVLQEVRDTIGNKPDGMILLDKMTRTSLSDEITTVVPNIGLPVAKSLIMNRVAYANAAGARDFVWNLGYEAKAASEEMITLFNEVMTYGEKEETGSDGMDGQRGEDIRSGETETGTGIPGSGRSGGEEAERPDANEADRF